MPQVFSADAQVNDAGVQFGTANPVPVVSTNPLQPPYQTCKAKVIVSLAIIPATDETDILVTIVRNPQSEAIELEGIDVVLPSPPPGLFTISLCAVDQVPDPRQVSYQVLCQGASTATTNDVDTAYIEATLISG